MSNWIDVEKLRWNSDLEVQVKTSGGEFEDLRPFLESNLAGGSPMPTNLPPLCRGPQPADSGCERRVAGLRATAEVVEVKLVDGDVLSLDAVLEMSTPSDQL